MRLIDHVCDDQLLEQVTIRIVLPEHTRNIEFYPPPYDVQRLPNEKHYTYLDTVGRPVIVITKRNMLFQHIQDFEIHYTFDKIMLLNEPMLIVIPLFGLFCLVIVLVRLNFAISQNESSEARMRIQAVWDQVVENNTKRTGFYQKLDDALNTYKTNKDMKSYTEQRKKIENEIKSIQQDLTALQAKVKVDSAESAEKIAELQRLDSQQRELQQALTALAEKLVGGKIQKQVYLDQEQALRTKLRDANARISAIINQY
jgi:oligosaccharyltransferase complex subunit alpha (ribophorin I)